MTPVTIQCQSWPHCCQVTMYAVSRLNDRISPAVHLWLLFVVYCPLVTFDADESFVSDRGNIDVAMVTSRAHARHVTVLFAWSLKQTAPMCCDLPVAVWWRHAWRRGAHAQWICTRTTTGNVAARAHAQSPAMRSEWVVCECERCSRERIIESSCLLLRLFSRPHRWRSTQCCIVSVFSLFRRHHVHRQYTVVRKKRRRWSRESQSSDCV